MPTRTPDTRTPVTAGRTIVALLRSADQRAPALFCGRVAQDATVRTIRTVRDAGDERASADRERDVVYVALCGDQPTAGGVAVEIVPGQVVVIARGAALAVEPRPGDGEVWLRLPDARVSERHAVVERQGDELRFEDLGSLNGSFKGGAAIRTTMVGDGESVVVGRTVLFFRRRVRDAGLGSAEFAGAPELRTLSPEVARVHDTLARAARSPVPVLLRGETGTGKEIAARALHALSGRAGRFVAVNCGALPDTLVESELFGYRRGAFSGAAQDRAGVIAAADGGTLLLDEVGELPAAAQVKLLRAVQEREVVPLGAANGEAVPVDFRLVCATHADLDALVARGRFRGDLMARIRGLDLELPPLRARRMDLGILIAALLARHAGADAASYRFDRRCGEALVAHEYPMNIRELEQALLALLALAGPDRLFRREALAETALGRGATAPAPSASRDPEQVRVELLEQLARHQGNVSAVARAMRCTRMQVHRWLKRWQIDAEGFRG
jgi:DNA-binding NtrC family response regulator